jgi:hypothetical protein
VLANACIIAIPVLIFTGTFGDLSYLAICGLAVAWVTAWIIAMCTAESSQPASRY